MPADTLERLNKAVDSFAARRRAIEVKERALVGSLNKALSPLGYILVRISRRSGAAPRRRGRR